MRVLIIHESIEQSVKKDMYSVAILLAAAFLGNTINTWCGIAFFAIALLYIAVTANKDGKIIASRKDAMDEIESIFREEADGKDA